MQNIFNISLGIIKSKIHEKAISEIFFYQIANLKEEKRPREK